MKKIASIAFALFYAVTSMGVAVNVHYCLGEIESVELLSFSKKCCCGDMEMPIGCCSDDTYLIQHDVEEQQTVESARFTFAPVTVLMPQLSIVLISEEDITSHSIPNFPQPFPPPNESLRLLYCSLTFYG